MKETIILTEQRISDLEDTVQPVRGDMKNAQNKLTEQKKKSGDFGDRLRQNSNHLLSFPGGGGEG